jgi:predicted ATPase
MFTKLRLKNFKSFRDAELALGPLTLLVGTNASGKSNLRDAFRFLHGIGRGYTLADIIGGKYGEGGDYLWSGIRGGIREIAFQEKLDFVLEVSYTIDYEGREGIATYSIVVALDTSSGTPQIGYERLVIAGYDFPFFKTEQLSDPVRTRAVIRSRPGFPQYIPLHMLQPALSQLSEYRGLNREVKELLRACLDILRSMRFLDLNPEVMRRASFPGQIVLGDRGENLSSVLQAICADPQRKRALVQWIQELTPMDAIDFEFPADQIGRVLVTLVEQHGQRTSAYSASDGTLRFLGMLAVLLGPESARLYCFEELENGIHPTRIDLLLQLIEQQAAQKNIQIVATTHSPQLLRLISPATLDYASLTYRLEGRPDAQIKRILDIPEARRIIEQHDLARLHESGWLENAVAFLEDEEVVV